MLSAEQSRAARGWLDWSQADLAERSRVSLSTIRDFEKGRRTPIANNLDAIERALTAAGIKLEEAGLRYEAPPLTTQPPPRKEAGSEPRSGDVGHE